jgi:hypothetical protein
VDPHLALAQSSILTGKPEYTYTEFWHQSAFSLREDVRVGVGVGGRVAAVAVVVEHDWHTTGYGLRIGLASELRFQLQVGEGMSFGGC